MLYLINLETSERIMSCFCCSSSSSLSSSPWLLNLLPFSTSILSPKFIVSQIDKVNVTDERGDNRLTQGIVIIIIIIIIIINYHNHYHHYHHYHHH